MEFKMQGSFSDEFKELQKQFPKETKKFMKKQAREFTKYAKKKSKTLVGKETGNYLKGFKAGKQVYSWNDAEYNIKITNTAPHGHLIELGHKQVGHKPNKVPSGTVEGREVLAKAMYDFKSDFESAVENELIDYLLEGFE